MLVPRPRHRRRKIALAAVQGWEIVRQASLPTESRRGFADGERVRESSLPLWARPVDGGLARGIGVGCAGPVDPVQGTIDNPFTLPGWRAATS
jgi:hypothetical protein